MVLALTISMPADAVAPTNGGGLKAMSQHVSAGRLKAKKMGKGDDDMTATYLNPTALSSLAGGVYKPSKSNTAKLYEMPSSNVMHQFPSLAKAETNIPMSTYYTLVVYSTGWDDEEDYGYGFYSFAPNSNEAVRLRTHEDLAVNGGGTYIGNNEYFCTVYEVVQGGVYLDHYTFNTNTWRMTGYEYGTDLKTIARDLAYDPDTELCYATTWNEDGSKYVFSAVNPRTYTAEVINEDIPETIYAITFDDKGGLWGVGLSGTLYSINKDTGEMTEVGDTGVVTTYTTGGTFDPASGRMLVGVMHASTSALYSINLQTAEAVKVYDYPNQEEIVGPWVPQAEAKDKAPAAPSNLAATFENGDLSGKVTFTMPTTCFDGSELSGSLDYVVKMNGKEAAKGSAAAGEAVEANVTVPASGSYLFVVQASNSEGSSPRATKRLYVGQDVPKPVSAVKATYEDGTFTVSWDPVTESVNGGYFDPEKLSYKVTRYCNESEDKVVAEANTSSTVTDAITEPSELSVFYYDVTPIYNGESLATTSSNKTALGTATPDLKIDFRYEDTSYLVNVVNNNNDNTYWKWDDNFSYDYSGMILSNFSSHKNDDYIFTVPVYLEAEREYNFETAIELYNKYCASRFNVVLATSPTADGVVEEIVATTSLNSSNSGSVVSQPFSVSTSGTYYIGVHSDMTSSRYGLICYYMNVLKGPMLAAPSYCNLEVTSDPSGATTSTGKVVAPGLSVAGDDLIEEGAPLTKLVVRRGTSTVFSVDNPTPGTEYSFTDKVSYEHEVTYVASAYNKYDEGYKTSVTTYLGVAKPASPASASGHQTENVGEVTLNWEEVTTDVYGSTRDKSLVVYDLANYDTGSWQLFEEGVAEPPHTFQATSDDAEQAFHNYLILARTKAGRNNTGPGTGAIAVGNPYLTPYMERFSPEGLSYILATSSNNSLTSWRLYQGTDYDGNQGYLRYGTYVGDYGRAYTGIINVDCDEPELRLFVMTFDTAESYFDIYINPDGEGYEPFVTEVKLEGENGAWTKFCYPLDKYKGRNIEVAVCASIQDKLFCMDDLSVKPVVHNNVVVRGLTVPSKMNALDSYEITAEVFNDAVDLANCTVELYCGDKCVDSKEVKRIPSDTTATVTFEHTPGLFTGEDAQVGYYVKAIMEGDEYEADNISATQYSTILRPNAPGVDLSMQTVDDNKSRKLMWSTPDLGGGSVEVTESVEEYPAFSIGLPHSKVEDDSIGDWTAVDRDGSNTWFNAGFKNNPNAKAPMAVIVMNPDELGVVNYEDDEDNEWPYYQARTGKQYFAFYDAQNPPSDDWLISPKLSGEAQTITFYAQTFKGEFGYQAMEFLTSSTTTDPDEFTLVDTVDKVPVGWTEYSYEVPAGTKYFAIHNITEDVFALMVDDLTFRTPSPFADYELQGYYLYCNGDRVNRSPMSAISYDIDYQTEYDRDYYVTAVYKDHGESDLSNCISIKGVSGVESLTAGGLLAIGSKGEIVVKGAEGKLVSVVTASGIKAAQLIATSNVQRIEAGAGVYIVSVGGKNFKVVVR